MSEVSLNSDQRDALQEIANIGMGKAGAELARLLDTFVTLSIPRIQLVPVSTLGQALGDMVGKTRNVTAVRQAFRCDLRGEAILVYDESGCTDLWDLVGYEHDEIASASVCRELLFDIANILIGACICSLFEQLGRSPIFAPPSLLAENVPVDCLLGETVLPWNVALLVEVNFTLKDRQFSSHLLTLMPEDSIQLMKCALDQFLNSL
jgi:chemotaxis protein CheC